MLEEIKSGGKNLHGKNISNFNNRKGGGIEMVMKKLRISKFKNMFVAQKGKKVVGFAFTKGGLNSLLKKKKLI